MANPNGMGRLFNFWIVGQQALRRVYDDTNIIEDWTVPHLTIMDHIVTEDVFLPEEVSLCQLQYAISFLYSLELATGYTKEDIGRNDYYALACRAMTRAYPEEGMKVSIWWRKLFTHRQMIFDGVIKLRDHE